MTQGPVRNRRPASAGPVIRVGGEVGIIMDIQWEGWSMTVRTTLFRSNRSQAVRLPKDVAVPVHAREVVILREGGAASSFRPTASGTISSTPPASPFRTAISPPRRSARRGEAALHARHHRLHPRPARPSAERARFNAEAGGRCISAVTLAERLLGAAKSNRPAKKRHEVGRLAARLAVLPFDEDAAGHFGDIRAGWSARGA